MRLFCVPAGGLAPARLKRRMTPRVLWLSLLLTQVIKRPERPPQAESLPHVDWVIETSYKTGKIQ